MGVLSGRIYFEQTRKCIPGITSPIIGEYIRCTRITGLNIYGSIILPRLYDHAKTCIERGLPYTKTSFTPILKKSIKWIWPVIEIKPFIYWRPFTGRWLTCRILLWRANTVHLCSIRNNNARPIMYDIDCEARCIYVVRFHFDLNSWSWNTWSRIIGSHILWSPNIGLY